MTFGQLCRSAARSFPLRLFLLRGFAFASVAGLLALAAQASPARNFLGGVGVVQHPGALVPPDVTLIDRHGRRGGWAASSGASR